MWISMVNLDKFYQSLGIEIGGSSNGNGNVIGIILSDADVEDHMPQSYLGNMYEFFSGLGIDLEDKFSGKFTCMLTPSKRWIK